MDWIKQFFGIIPEEIIVAIIGGLPILEVRAAIPVGIQMLNMAPEWSFIWSVIGNIVATVAFLYALRPIESICTAHLPTCNRLVQKYFTRARKAFEGTHAKYGAFALAVFIAIPLPLTGAWTGAAAAHVLGLPKRVAVPSMILGSVCAGIVVTLATLGVIKVF